MLNQSNEELLFEQWTGEYETDRSYVGAGLAADVVEQVLRILQERGQNQPWLAGQMGVSRQSVNRIFQAAPNMQLLTLAGLAIALGVKPKILVDSESYFVQPIDTSLTYEDWTTEREYQIARRNAGSTDDTTFPYGIEAGVMSHGTA